jgi:anaphase-promoting complex subunit 8
LTSIAQSDDYASISGDESDSSMLTVDGLPRPLFSTTPDDPQEAALETKEGHKYILAKSYFDTREYDRCAAVFLPLSAPAGGLLSSEKNKKASIFTPPKGKTSTASQSPVNPFPKLSQKSLFLALYARYIAGEKRKDEESEMILGPNDGGQTINRDLSGLGHSLETYFSSQTSEFLESQSQGWLEYLYGIVLSKSKNESSAREWLVRAIHRNPFHWGAWEELATLLPSTNDSMNEKIRQSLPESVMTFIFNIHLSIDLSTSSDSSSTFDSLHELLQIFPTSTFLSTSLALLHYHSKDFEAAAQIFQQILTAHPHRLDALDHYSNILYVMADRPKLSFLAHLATATDKFRPETCCVVGNYYSLCSQHEKAVLYFRRALTLDKNFLSAWTLMGHEYVEMKNTHAAIESYRRAVDLNRKDYRAWYGLGQAYEVLDMAFYALFYYQRAAALRPYDPQMWQAVGSCYSKMGRVEQSIKALKRALVAGTYYEPVTPTPTNSFSTSISSQTSARGDKQQKAATTGRKLLDPETLYQIATLYEKLGDLEEAARFMELTVAQETGSTAKRVSKASVAARRYGMDDDDGSIADDATEVLSDESESDDDIEADGDGFGLGTTATTSKARLWLARWAVRRGDLDIAERLAEELCVDGYEVEEAKGLVREVRGRREAEAEGGAGG